jgi:hypothetical protein
LEYKENEKYNELAYYTLQLQDECFIHQYIVDAYTIQTADSNTKKISIIFALVGLYLYVEKGYTGKEVQRFHTWMSNNKINWPEVELPIKRGNVTVAMVVDKDGDDRIKMMNTWCNDVWNALSSCHLEIEKIATYYLNLKQIERKNNFVLQKRL